MEEFAGWVAPIATTVAAMMTASNLGPRVTGWGFAVFVIGSLAWVAVALASGQTNLLVANGFLTVVNIVGVWRWLGREVRWQEGADAAEQDSEAIAVPSLFATGGIADAEIRGPGGRIVAHAVDAMAESGSGRIAYLMIREGGAGGVGEHLHALDWAALRHKPDGFAVELDRHGIAALPTIDPAHWPAGAPRPA